MLIDFTDIKEITAPCMNNGTGMMSTKMVMDPKRKVITCAIRQGSAIGMHTHESSDDINYVLSGTGKAICDGQEEPLKADVCHICKKGSAHSIINTGLEDLVLFTVVVER